MKSLICRVTVAALLLSLACSTSVRAQALRWDPNLDGTGGDGNWTDGSKWDFDGVNYPDSSFGDSEAVISTVPASVVTVNTVVPQNAPTTVLGVGAGQAGTLNIESGGNLHVVTESLSDGRVEIGLDGGTGTLNVNSGTLTVDARISTPAQGNPASLLSLSGTANLNAESASLDTNLIINGSSVTFHVTGDLSLGAGGTHAWSIPAAGPSTILVGGNVDLGGTLKVEFPDGTPSIGSSWNLIDSATVDALESPRSGFGTVDQSAVSGLETGETFSVKSVPDAGSINGVFTTMTLEQHPVLVVERRTGTTYIKNFSGTNPTVNFDTYIVGSTGEYLNSDNWTTIDPHNGWLEASKSSTTLSELNPTSSESLAPSDLISLGSPFTAPSRFGEENEDITFLFGKADPYADTFTEGTVIYTGVPNNTLTLNVDPDTGAAQIVNGTPFTVSIDSYTISSAGEMLDPGPWSSLQVRGTSDGNWYEANVSTGQLAELLVVGGLELAPNATVNLGTPYVDPSELQDLEFQFSVLAGLNADYNQDGTVNAADFTVWRDTLGSTTDVRANGDDTGASQGVIDNADYTYWKTYFGLPIIPGAEDMLTGKVLYGPLVDLGVESLAAAVPEPNSGILGGMCLAVLGLLANGRRP